jgi:hypothetical protein
MFSDQQISREGPIMWPPIFEPHSTRLPFVVIHKELFVPWDKNMQALREHVRNAVAQITPNMLENS